MADAKISALTALTGANVASSTDLLAIVDTSVTTTKKITIDEFDTALWAKTAHTIGANYTATRAAGTVAAGVVSGMKWASSFTGDAGGTTDFRANTFTLSTGGANNIDAAYVSLVSLDHAVGVTLATARGSSNSFVLSSTGSVTTGSGYYSGLTLSSSGNATSFQHFNAATPTLSSTGAVTTLTGFAVGNLGHASLVTNALGFDAADMTASVTLTAGFRGRLTSGTGKYNLYIDGTADNVIVGHTRFGANNAPSANGILEISGTRPSVTNSWDFISTGQSLATSTHNSFYSLVGQATNAINVLAHFRASQGTFGSAVTTQVGFYASDTMTGAGSNYGFYGEIEAGASRYNLYMVGTAQNYFAGDLTIYGGTAIPAGGTAGGGYKFSSTSNFGVFFGSGAPTLAAGKGSLYLRSDGSGTTNRSYINTDGGTTWTALITAA